MLALSTDVLDRLWPRAAHSLVDGMARTSAAALAKYGIATLAELIDLMAQISEETGGGVEIEENLNYTVERMRQVWPRVFPTDAAAAPFAHQPRLLADYVYGGRYGNRAGGDDGWNYRGRGAIQITFRDWYAKIGAATGLDLIGDPDLANDPDRFLECACAYWKLDDVNYFADRGDFQDETIKINGALTNYSTRAWWRKAWSAALAGVGVQAGQGAQETAASAAAPLRPTPAAPAQGAQEDAPGPVSPVRSASPPAAPQLASAPAAALDLDAIPGQVVALNRLGAQPPLPLPPLAPSTPALRQAIAAFQATHGCEVDGEWGPQTKTAVKKALGLAA